MSTLQDIHIGGPERTSLTCCHDIDTTTPQTLCDRMGNVLIKLKADLIRGGDVSISSAMGRDPYA